MPSAAKNSMNSVLMSLRRPTTGMSGAGPVMSGIQTERATGIHSMPLVRPLCHRVNAIHTNTAHVAMPSTNETAAGIRRPHASAPKTQTHIAIVAHIQILTLLA